MRILFDQGTPAPLRHFLEAHTVSTTYELGWDQLKNGDLLKQAEPDFDAFVTTDQGLKYQQNPTDRKLAIAVLPTTNWPQLKVHVAVIVKAINALQPGDFCEITLPR